MVDFDEEKSDKKISTLHKEEEEGLYQMLSEKYGIPYIDLTITPINIDALRVIKEEDARKTNIAVFNIVDKKVSVAILSPNNPETVEAINAIKGRGYEVHIFLASHVSLNKVWERYKDLSFSFETKGGALDISNDEITGFLEKVHTLPDIQKLIEETLTAKRAYRISKTLEIILAGALAMGASDVHIEPEENNVRLRYRLDGVLRDVLTFDSETYALIIPRIKLLSGLKLNVKGEAQDGRFSIKISDSEIEIRTSVLPGAYNDSFVLRILNPKSISVPLEDMGMHPRLLNMLLHEIEKPNGMLLTTGPTGSGKTTTLYAFLRKIHSPDIKIITIENPIEYHLPGIVQTQTDNEKGYTFLAGLRSALRQDPDVIMVGEIRDEETAEIAINAALTGHLVFSTLHTNNAAGTFPRLMDLGVNPKVITSSINVSMAQRLLRKLCPNCKKEVTLDEETKKLLIDKVVGSIKDKTYMDGVQTEKMWTAVGCDKCNGIGYKGRTGVFEAIIADKEIEKAVMLNPSEREIRAAAEGQNMIDMRQDGVIKILQGLTSLDELRRVIDMEAE